MIIGIHSVIVSTLREVKNTRAKKSSPPSPPSNYLNFPFKNEIRKKSRWGWLARVVFASYIVYFFCQSITSYQHIFVRGAIKLVLACEDHISLLSYFEVRMWGVFFCHIEKKKRETYTIFQHTNESYWKFERKQSRLKTLIYYGLKTYAFKKLKIYYTEISECQKRRTPKSLILDIIFQCHPTLCLGTNYKHNECNLSLDRYLQ